jgi:AcrR family transcriptional regulator
MNVSRPYSMARRAELAAQTRLRLLQASVDLHSERLMADISLDDIAARAEVSVQTLLRHFGSRAALVEETITFARAAVEQERRATPGDVSGGIRVLVDHYEARGDTVLLMLAQESSEPFVRRVTDQGRVVHQSWVEEVFAPHLQDAAARDEREVLLDLLVVATDVLTWKLLRRDRGLSRQLTESRLLRLVEALLEPPPSTDRERTI